jgi:macrodomain Ter protein organizer (MatP/YcbG family)
MRSIDPWSDPDPSGGLRCRSGEARSRYIERHDREPAAELIVLVGVEGEDAKRLERLAEARGKTAAAVVSDLVSEAERSAA